MSKSISNILTYKKSWMIRCDIFTFMDLAGYARRNDRSDRILKRTTAGSYRRIRKHRSFLLANLNGF